MTNEEALKFAKEQTYIFGGTMKEFLQFVIDKLERPQGEWIKTFENEIVHNSNGEPLTTYVCSVCNRYLTCYPSMLNEFPFCHCGAKMQKGGADNDK